MTESSTPSNEHPASWTALGRIEMLQMQYWEMTGKGAYDLDALVGVDRMRLTPDGIYGLVDGGWVMDRHHKHHPASKYWHAEDVLSFGFTSHYQHMEALFRPIPLGIAGENVIVMTDAMVSVDDIDGGLKIGTETDSIEFGGPEVAEPCVEFSRFMAARPDATATEIKPQREQLRHGVRGYVVGVTSDQPFEIGIGDHVWARRQPN